MSLQERLREEAVEAGWIAGQLYEEAAAELDRLQARVAELEEPEMNELTDEQIEAALKGAGINIGAIACRPPTVLPVAGGGLDIKTLEGTMRADVGDWIIQGVKGELYPCKPDIFAATYEPVIEPSADAALPTQVGD